jgi:hypothetical protein
MVKFTVNTTLKLFIAKAGITSFNVKADLYSDAKEDWLAGGAVMGFDFPIRVIGGDPVGGGVFAGDLYFLRDGWKLRPDEADHTLTITGNLFLDEGEAGQLVVPTLGDFTVLVMGVRSNLVLGITTTGTAPADIWTYSSRALTDKNGFALSTAGNQAAAVEAWNNATRSLTDKNGFALSAAGNQAVVDELKAETFDGRTFADILPDLLAMAAGRIVEGPAGTFTFYERNNTTVRYTLSKVNAERLRS